MEREKDKREKNLCNGNEVFSEEDTLDTFDTEKLATMELSFSANLSDSFSMYPSGKRFSQCKGTLLGCSSRSVLVRSTVIDESSTGEELNETSMNDT